MSDDYARMRYSQAQLDNLIGAHSALSKRTEDIEAALADALKLLRRWEGCIGTPNPQDPKLLQVMPGHGRDFTALCHDLRAFLARMAEVSK